MNSKYEHDCQKLVSRSALIMCSSEKYAASAQALDAIIKDK